MSRQKKADVNIVHWQNAEYAYRCVKPSDKDSEVLKKEKSTEKNTYNVQLFQWAREVIHPFPFAKQL